MPIVNTAGVITESAPHDLDQWRRTGVMHAVDFAVCDTQDRVKQIHMDPSALTSGVTATIAAGAATGNVTYTLPTISATLASTINTVAFAYTYNAPVTTDSITIAANKPYLILEPAGTIALATVVLPTAPADGFVQTVSAAATITGLTLSGGGSDTVVNAITTLLIGGSCKYLYKASTSKWYRVG